MSQRLTMNDENRQSVRQPRKMGYTMPALVQGRFIAGATSLRRSMIWVS